MIPLSEKTGLMLVFLLTVALLAGCSDDDPVTPTDNPEIPQSLYTARLLMTYLDSSTVSSQCVTRGTVSEGIMALWQTQMTYNASWTREPDCQVTEMVDFDLTPTAVVEIVQGEIAVSLVVDVDWHLLTTDSCSTGVIDGWGGWVHRCTFAWDEAVSTGSYRVIEFDGPAPYEAGKSMVFVLWLDLNED